MAVKNYGVHDKWTDLDKLNVVEFQSEDGVISDVYINGESAGGGGDSSDLSTAQLTIIPQEDGFTFVSVYFSMALDLGDDDLPEIYIMDDPIRVFTANMPYTVTLVKGKAILFSANDEWFYAKDTNNITHVWDYESEPTITGNATRVDDNFIITGDCTITIPMSAID